MLAQQNSVTSDAMFTSKGALETIAEYLAAEPNGEELRIYLRHDLKDGATIGYKRLVFNNKTGSCCVEESHTESCNMELH